MSPSENIRLARIRAGVEPDAVARAAGLNKPSYFDVEGHDDEVTGNISLRSLSAIAHALKTTPLELLAGHGAVGLASPRPAAELPDLARVRLSGERLTVEEYGDRIGWDLAPVLADPEYLWEYPFDMLHSLCEDLEVDWREWIEAPRPPG
jgi:transcriptional regulator with XRE-family HTH domain